MGTASNFATASCRVREKRQREIGWLSPFFRSLVSVRTGDGYRELGRSGTRTPEVRGALRSAGVGNAG